MAPHHSGDSYPRRLAVAALVAAAAYVVVSLLGPDANPDGEWYVHTGIDGPIQMMDAIEIVPDEDPARQRESRRMPGATEGVKTPITERVVNEDNPETVAREKPIGRDVNDPDVMRRVEPEVMAELQEQEFVEMNRPSQQSDEFVLLHAVQPRYPKHTPPAQRAREILVRVNMYVEEDGTVAHAYVDRNEGGPRFERAVLEAVRQWRYRPVTRDGRTVGFWDQIYFVFRVTGEGTPRPVTIPSRG